MKGILACAMALLMQPALAQNDTIVIQPSMINTAVLKPGVRRYLVYFQNGKDAPRSKFQLWTRTISHDKIEGHSAIRIQQEWTDNDSIVHTTNSYSDEKTLQPLYHEFWWKNRDVAKFDFIKKKAWIGSNELTTADTSALKKGILTAFQKSWDQYFINWHLDLETFPVLPYKEGRTFMINFYDPGFATAPQLQPYTVTGSGTLTGYNGEAIDCWLLTHTSPDNKEVFWVSKKTHEVLKLEQQYKNLYRYKIKLGFSA